jgi:hypothetical protein
MLTRQADVQPASVNLERRTVDVVWSTGARNLTYDFQRGMMILEELSLSPGQVRLDRLNRGAPVLDSHNRWSLDCVKAVVERGWLEDGKGKATIRFSQRADVEPIWQDVVAGIIRSVSIGYRVYKYEDVTPADGSTNGVPVKRAIDWEVYEVSLVAVPVDIGAGVRADHVEKNECELVGDDLETRDMKPNAVLQDTQKNPQPAAIEDSNPIAKTAAIVDPHGATRAMTMERERVSEILKLSQRAKLPATFQQRMIDEGLSLDQVRAQVIDTIADREPEQQARHLEVTREEGSGTMQAMKLALLNRYSPDRYKIAEGDQAREFRGMSLLELGKEALTLHGVKYRGMSKSEIAGLCLRAIANSTSDFPSILANVAHKVLRDQYQEQPQTFRPFCRVMPLPDFKPMNLTQLGASTVLKKVTEAGEFQYGQVSDAKEAMSLLTYGEILAITRQTIINDDLQAFTRLPALMAAAAARLEADIVYGILTANAAMGDGVALFHATHANVGTKALNTSTPNNVAGLDALYQLIRLAKGLAGEYLNLTPRTVVVPPQLATIARQLLQQTTNPVTDATTNPFKGDLVPIVEARLSVNPAYWYMFANPGEIDLISIGYLDGEMGPSIETRIGFEIDGVEMKIREDFTAKAVDWRGMARSDGTTA